MLIESCWSSHAHRVIPRLVSTHASVSCEFLTCTLHEYAHKSTTVCIIVVHVQRQELSVFLAYKRREFFRYQVYAYTCQSCGGNRKSFAALAARVLCEGRARRGGFQLGSVLGGARTKTGIVCLFSVQRTGIFQISRIRLHMSIMWG